MTLSIEYPPTTKACARCSSPLTWCWSDRSRKWFAAVPESDDPDLFRVHRCPQYPDDRPPPSWRETREIDPGTAAAGAALVREALAGSKDQQGGET